MQFFFGLQYIMPKSREFIRRINSRRSLVASAFASSVPAVTVAAAAAAASTAFTVLVLQRFFFLPTISKHYTFVLNKFAEMCCFRWWLRR